MVINFLLYIQLSFIELRERNWIAFQEKKHKQIGKVLVVNFFI